ncbi:MAG TPA: PEP/pyruvate-binding domain-containing protein [Nitrospira sp.]|nr:PEP/pyruvate-binding domain-containing protein [Nitrospira sp.]
MAHSSVLPLLRCTNLELVGGKALGLARLMAAGFPVPPGVCVTTEAYRQSLLASAFTPAEEWKHVCTLSEEKRKAALSACQARIKEADTSSLTAEWQMALQALNVPRTTSWAVRSSATNEDAGRTSFAGLYRTHLGVSIDRIDDAIKDLWSSIWQERVLRYSVEHGGDDTVPSMAVVIQPMLDALSSGVAYSIHPVTGRSFYVAVNAVPGLAAPLVDGHVTPDQYVVQMGADQRPAWIRRRTLANKVQRLTVAQDGLRSDAIPASARSESSLSDEQLFELGAMAKQIEQAFGYPVDLEWAIDARGLWTLQARPITGVSPSSQLTDDDCEWSRANFKETMPELPSPVGNSFLELFMDQYIIEPYRRLGCHIPSGLTSTRIFHGRPYLNVTLFHILVAQLRGDPSQLPEQMGGEPIAVAPAVHPLGWLAFIRAGIVMSKEMRRATAHGPAWFAEMKTMATQFGPQQIEVLSFDETVRKLDELSAWFQSHELTFGIAGGVAQCLQALSFLLPRWLGSDWRVLSNAALQGQGTVISAQQILRLAEIVDIARQEPAAETFLNAEPWDPTSFRTALKDTACLHAFDAYLEDYGHRGIGESDVMSPRLADNPEAIMSVLRLQLGAAPFGRKEILSRQERTRAEALAEIKRRLGWRMDRWFMYRWWYRRLCRFFALREANRHHLMYFSTATRTLLLHLGDLLVAQGACDARDDIFFLTVQDRADLVSRKSRDWRGLIRERRAERDRNAAIEVPDTIRDWETATASSSASDRSHGTGPLVGLPISAGSATGPVRLLRSLTDWSTVKPGDILVAPVIDPGMAPLFGIAGGLIVEMGGTLSHGAIIAREYGLPTVANVEAVMTRLEEGQRVRLDAAAGTIHVEPGL